MSKKRIALPIGLAVIGVAVVVALNTYSRKPARTEAVSSVDHPPYPIRRVVPSDEPADLLAFTRHEPVYARQNDDAGLLYRELFRQALSIAASQELGMLTRDMVVGEIEPSGKPEAGGNPDPKLVYVRTRVTHGGTMQMALFRGTPPELLWMDESALTEESSESLLRGVAWAASLSRTDLPAALKSAGFSSRANGSAAPDSAGPVVQAGAPESMTLVAQFMKLRSINRALGTAPDDKSRSELLEARVRTCANLGDLTSYQWSATDKAYYARALLYAERLILGQPDRAGSWFARAYARAMAGLHAAALEDLDHGEELVPAGNTAPSWVPLVKALCRYDTDGLMKVKGDDAPLAGIFAVRTVEGGAASHVERVISHALSTNPGCIRLYDAMSNVGGVSRLHESTRGGVSAVLRSVVDVLRMPGLLPDSAVKEVEESMAGDPFRAHALLCRVLSEEGATDRRFPSRLQLATLMRDAALVQVCRRGQFMAYEWSVPDAARKFVQEALPVVEDHRYGGLLKTYAIHFQRERDRFDAAVRDIKVDDVRVHMGALLNAIDPYQHAPPAPAMDLRSLAWAHGDNVARDLRHVLAKASFEEKLSAARLLREVSPNSPKAAAVLIQLDWENVKPLARRWRSEFSSHPDIWMALGRRHEGAGEFGEAALCYEKHIELAGDKTGYYHLAGMYRNSGDDSRWLSVMKRAVKGLGGLEQSSAANDVARFLMSRERWEEAKLYAEDAGSSWSQWGMDSAAGCAEGMGDMDRANLWRMRISKRYESSEIDWFLWCQRTGHGDISAASDLADAFYTRVGDGLAAGAWTNKGIVRILQKRPKEAVRAFERTIGDGNPFSLLHLALLGMELKDTDLRDRALGEAIGKGADFRIVVWPRHEMVDLARHIREVVASDGRSQPDLKKVDAMIARADADEQANLYYFAGRFLDFYGTPDQAKRYYTLGMASDRFFKSNRTLCCQVIRERGWQPPVIKRVPEEMGLLDKLPSNQQPRQITEVRLNNDDEAKKRLVRVAQAPTPPFASMNWRKHYLWNLADAYAGLRRYDIAERLMKQVALTVGEGHSNVCVYMGKQGKYAEAAALIRAVRAAQGTSNTHTTLLLAEYEWGMGNREEARKLLEGVLPPASFDRMGLYHGSLACLAAAMGAEADIRKHVEKAVQYDPDNQIVEFARRDVVFDPYRAKPWFIEIFGETLEK